MKDMNGIRIHKHFGSKQRTSFILFLALLLLVVGQGDAPTGFRFVGGISGKDIAAQVFDHIVCMPVKINRSLPLDFILDTGAADICGIDEVEAGKLKLAFGRKISTNGAGEETVDSYKLGKVLFSLPGIDFVNLELSTLPLKRLVPFWGKEIEGIIGGNVLEQVVTEIDYVNRTVHFYDPADFHYNGPGERIPISIYYKSPYVIAKISVAGATEPIEGLFLLDTGLRGMVFNGPFHRRHSLAEKSPRIVKNTLGFGIGGESRGMVGRVKSLSINGITFNNPVVGFSLDRQGVLSSGNFAGAIGTTFLHRFRIFFNYAEKEMILEKNKFFAESFEYDMSGIFFITEGERFDRIMVYNILENSPAVDAGLKKGDIIVSIDDRKAGALTMEEIRRLFIGVGKKVRLEIQRNSNTFTVTLGLRRLV